MMPCKLEVGSGVLCYGRPYDCVSHAVALLVAWAYSYPLLSLL